MTYSKIMPILKGHRMFNINLNKFFMKVAYSVQELQNLMSVLNTPTNITTLSVGALLSFLRDKGDIIHPPVETSEETSEKPIESKE